MIILKGKVTRGNWVEKELGITVYGTDPAGVSICEPCVVLLGVTVDEIDPEWLKEAHRRRKEPPKKVETLCTTNL